MVKYEVAKEGETYQYTSVASHQDCPRGIQSGEEIIIKNFEASYPFYRSFNELFTVLKKMESRNQGSQKNIDTSSTYGETKILWSILLEPSIALTR